MTTLRTTAIMKTDIRDSTARFWMLPEVDLHTLHTEHTSIGSSLRAWPRPTDGRVVKGEGDGYPWAEGLHSVDIGLPSPRLAGIAIYKLQ